MSFGWLEEHALVILFYLSVALLIYFNRKKFEFQGIVVILKTKLGISQMKKFATPLKNKGAVFGNFLFFASTLIFIVSTILILLQIFFGLFQSLMLLQVILGIIMVSFLGMCVAIVFFRQIKPASTLGIYAGFLGMLFMMALLGVGLYQLFFDPSAPPMFAPVLPGISIPGSPIKLPLFEGLIALLVVVAIHEFSHGVVSKAYKIPIKSSGFVMFGPIPGAFVEPDEKKLKKASSKAQLSVYGAGPFSNVLLAGFIFILLMPLISVISMALYEPSGVVVDGFIDHPLLNQSNTDLKKGDIIMAVNQVNVTNSNQLTIALQNLTPHEKISVLTDSGEKTFSLQSNPLNESLPFLGIYIDNAIEGKRAISKNKVFTNFYFWLFGNSFSLNLNRTLGLLPLIFILSFGIGLVNLLPIGPLDGGRMVLLVLNKKMSEEKALRLLTFISKILIFLVIILVFIPIIRALI